MASQYVSVSKPWGDAQTHHTHPNTFVQDAENQGMAPSSVLRYRRTNPLTPYKLNMWRRQLDRHDLHPHFPSSMYYLTHDWPLISHWLSLLHSIILPLTKPSSTLLLPKPLQQAFAETVLLSLPSLSQTYTHSTPLHLYTSDTSMTCCNPDNCSCEVFTLNFSHS